MNILFLSRLSGAPYAGPTYSVPRQVDAQSEVDSVFWYNATIPQSDSWRQLPYYHDLRDFPEESISQLPKPFCNPDIIVVEQFYNWGKSRLLKDVLLSNVPYVLIPRGEFTKQAQERKKIKKHIANILLFKRFAKHAAAIHFLTNQEYEDSGMQWNSNHFVLPNGIDAPKVNKTAFSPNSIRCVSIGRIEPFQKGLDLLIAACAQIREDLEQANCTVSIYGPDVDGKKRSLQDDVHERGLDSIIQFYDGVYGDEKEAVLQSSDIFLLPSRFEGHPMALVEALSIGLPCIVTSGSNMLEEIARHKAGWVSETTVAGIAQSFKKMLLQKDQFLQMSVNAKCLAENYLWSRIAINYHDELDDILH